MGHNTQPDARRGQALVEFALTVPILLMVVFGIIDFARLLYAYSHAIDAARQGVRYGIVEGLEVSTYRYQFLDCDGIRNAARSLAGLNRLADAQVDVFYERTDGTKITDCVPGLTLWDVGHGDVLAVRVQSQIAPITPVLMLFTDSIPFSYTSRRTIVEEGAASTATWQVPPPAPTNFQATVDCNRSADNVSFTWDPMTLATDPNDLANVRRAEIRNAVTGAVVANIDDVAPGLITEAFCNNCATIPPVDGFGLFYLVAFSGTPPSEMASPPSNDAAVTCTGGSISGPLNSISGHVFEDKDLDRAYDGAGEGLNKVTVWVLDAGPDNSFITEGDNYTYYQTTNSKGEYSFTSLYPFKNPQSYRVEVAEYGKAIGTLVLTIGTNPTEVSIAEGGNLVNVDFGFTPPPSP